MKIRWTVSTNCPPGQFVITAENDVERAILQMFVTWPQYAAGKWRFHMHGYGGSSQNVGTDNFNFGYIREKGSED